MKTRTIATLIAMSALLGTAGIVAAEDGTDADRSHPHAFVTDSAITAKIKTKLAVDHITSLGHIKVDTDKDGVVWLSGTTHTQEAADQAVSIARGTEGVRSVHSDLTVRKDD